MDKHSPAPWRYEVRNTQIADTGDYDGLHEVNDANGKFIVQLYGEEERIEADARLIAAAPEMFEALKLARRWLLNCMPIATLDGPKPLPVIAAALAKAGESLEE